MLPAFWKSGKILTSPEHLLHCSCQIISQPVTLQLDSMVFIFKKLCIVVSVSVYDTFLIIIMVKEQWLHFAGTAVKRYPMSKVRETQVRW